VLPQSRLLSLLSLRLCLLLTGQRLPGRRLVIPVRLAPKRSPLWRPVQTQQAQ